VQQCAQVHAAFALNTVRIHRFFAQTGRGYNFSQERTDDNMNLKQPYRHGFLLSIRVLAVAGSGGMGTVVQSKAA